MNTEIIFLILLMKALNKMNKILTILLLFPLFFSGEIIAQNNKSENPKPQWLHHLPTPSNSTFSYEINKSIGNSLQDARDKSTNGMVSMSGLENGVVVISNYQTNTSHSSQFVNGELKEVVENEFNSHSDLKGNEVKLNLKSVAEYWEVDDNGNYHLTTLYQKSLNQNPVFDNVELTTKYGALGLWRSAIVPGWGQMYKGSYVKGGCILGGTVLIIGGIIWTESMRIDYNNKIGKTHDANLKKKYASDRDNWALGRNICIGGLAALYVYNIVDAIVAPGARRIVVHSIGNNGKTFALMPSIVGGNTPGMFFDFTF